MNLVQRLKDGWKRYKNRRLYRRNPVDLPIRLRRCDTGETLDERMTNWSPDGVFVATQSEIPNETLVDVEFSFSGDQGTFLRLRGQVVRHQYHPQNRKFQGLGIMFTDYTQSGLYILRDLLDNVYRSEDGLGELPRPSTPQ